MRKSMAEEAEVGAARPLERCAASDDGMAGIGRSPCLWRSPFPLEIPFPFLNGTEDWEGGTEPRQALAEEEEEGEEEDEDEDEDEE